MKNVNRKTKNAFLIALSAIAAVSLSAGVGAVGASAAENDAAKLETYVTGGASIRLSGNWGIRFQTLMEEADYTDMTAENSGFVTGVLAIPADMLDIPDDLTLENVDAQNAVTFDGEVDRWHFNEDEGKYESFAFLDGNDIPALSYSRNLSFRGYYTYGNETVYGDVVNRSMTYVAQAELEDDAKATAENAENKDLILDDEQEIKAQSFVKDYTVAYVDGVTNKLITTQTVVAGDSVADNKVSGDVADPTLFGGVFAGWTKQGATWQGEEELLTGDTVVKANYTAATELDFSKATEVPLYLATNHNATGVAKEMKIENGALYGTKWSSDTFTISFLDEITLEKGDKLIIEVDATQDRWFEINLKSATASTQIFNQSAQIRANATFDNAANFVRVRDFCMVYYEAPAGGLTFQTVEFAHAQAVSLDFYVKSIKVEKAVALTAYDYYNVDFSALDAVPNGFVTTTDTNVSKRFGYDATEDALWMGERRGGMQFKFPDIALEEGDIINLTIKSTMGGGNIKLNNTTQPTGWYVNIGDYKTATYTVPAGGMTLSSIYFLSYYESGGAEYYVKSVKIMKANAKLSGSIDLNNISDSDLANDMHAFTVGASDRTSVVLATEEIDGVATRVIKGSNITSETRFRAHFDSLTLKAGQTISVKVNVVPEKGNSSTGFGFRINDVWKVGGAINGWTTVSWTADVDTEIDYIQIRPYDATSYTYTISIASITIS